MFNKPAKLALVSTALAPICLTMWFVEISNTWQPALSWPVNLVAHWHVGIGYLLVAVILSVLCIGLVRRSASHFEPLQVKMGF